MGEIGGDRVSITDLTPAGVEPHDLELTPGQVRDLSAADLIVYLGDGFQPAVEEVVADSEAALLDGLATEDLIEGGEEEGGGDPHVWLDPQRMLDLGGFVQAKLAEIDPEGSAGYEASLRRLRDELTALDDDYSEGLADCERREIVTSHEAFGYLADRYELEQVGIAGIDPESEPSPARLAEVAEFARDNGVTTIFFEELAPEDIAETLASELGIETVVLNPLETKPEDGDYLTEMRRNLEALKDALGCE